MVGAERHFTCFRRQSARRCPRDRRSVLYNALPVLLWPGRDEARGEVRVADTPGNPRTIKKKGGTERTIKDRANARHACASSAFWRLFCEAETRARRGPYGFLMKNVGRFPRFWYSCAGRREGAEHDLEQHDHAASTVLVRILL